jgi:uncharacterized membrane-anchored protein YhcB (DUF1043 family)
MFTAIAALVCLIVGFIAGSVRGRQAEQKAVAKVLAEFSAVDRQARESVNRCYRHFADGVKAELNKLLPS